jgi:ketosteroid isomerase-like protein
MKRCPACQSTYTDDSLAYCLQDGTALQPMSQSSLPADPQATLVLPLTAQTEGRRSDPTAETPQRLTTPITHATKPKNTATVVGLTAAATLLLLAVGGFGAWALFREDATVTSQNSESRNVTVERNTSGAAATPSASSSSSSSNAPSSVDSSALKKEVVETLTRWAQTIRARDIAEHMKYYADPLEVYYAQTNVPAERVRADRVRAFSKYTTLDIKLTNMNIEIEPGGTRAVATFDKTFDFQGEKNFSGSGLNRFWLVKSGGSWRITGEKDLKTYYVNK